MPYIQQQMRRHLEPLLRGLERHVAAYKNEGELNYIITRLVQHHLGQNPGYADYNRVIGVLECAKLEFYRRAAAAYEDKKIEVNGDVYGG